MRIFNNLKIGQRIYLLMILIFLVVLITNLFNLKQLNTIESDCTLARDESVVYTLIARDFQVDVIQVQQWLTDISATRGLDGLDDGFAEAALSFEHGLLQLNQFQTMYEEEGDSEGLEYIEAIRSDFTAFYEVGKKMAQQYIENGPSTGNVLMEEFDPYAAIMIERVDKLVASQTDELNTAMNDVIDITGSTTKIAIITLFGLVAFIGIASVVLTRNITKPINSTVAMIKDIAQGEGDMTVRLPVESKDELGDLAKWFNTFVEKLQGVITQVKVSTEQIGNASTQLSSTSEELASGAEEQQSQLSDVATSIEEMSAMILEASRNAGDTQENASQANEAAGMGQNTVQDTISGIEEIASIVQASSDQIKSLESRSNEIGEVIQVIDDIADQTNLLALNANIEAARAGDAGRGFAVVADEVRKLAERTVKATAKIGDMIKLIQTDVGSTVGAMSKIQNQSQQGQELAGQAGTALEEISGSIANVSNAVTQIASSAQEQSSGVEEISKNVENVSTVSRQAASAAQQLAASSEELSREVQGLNDLMNQFKV